MLALFPAVTDYTNTGAIVANTNNILRAQRGFKYLVLAITEMLNVIGEAVALEAVTSPDAPGSMCADIMIIYQVRSIVTFYTNFMTQSQPLLVSVRSNGITASLNSKQYTCQATTRRAGWGPSFISPEAARPTCIRRRRRCLLCGRMSSPLIWST